MRNILAWLGLVAVTIVVGVAAWHFRGQASTLGADMPVAVSSTNRDSTKPATSDSQGLESVDPVAPLKRLKPIEKASGSAADLPVPAASLVPSASVGSVDLPPEIRQQVEHFKDASVAVDVRLKELEDLAARANAADLRVLEALGNEYTYLNYAAIEMLGKVQGYPALADYLRGKLMDSDPRVLSAAVRSLAQQQGAAAVGDIAKVVKDNRRRLDGFEDNVCAACVQAMADIRSPTAIPVLDVELRETVGPILNYDYGSQVVAALLAIGDAKALPVLLAYADRLSEILARADANPLGRTYLEVKIKEAREAAEVLGKSLQP